MKELTVHLVALGFLLVCLAAYTWFSAYNEARTYSRLTGKSVTTWDALWVDLRVQEGVK